VIGTELITTLETLHNPDQPNKVD
jgi:hypothetical protein